MYLNFNDVTPRTEEHTWLAEHVEHLCDDVIDSFENNCDGSFIDRYQCNRTGMFSFIATAEGFDEKAFLRDLKGHFKELCEHEYVERFVIGHESPYPWSCGITGHGVTCDILYFKGTLKIKFEARPDTTEA